MNLAEQTDAEFIAELGRFGVPFGAKIASRFVPAPPAAWNRVFAVPPGDDGLPPRKGGLDPDVVAQMRKTLPSKPCPSSADQARPGNMTLPWAAGCWYSAVARDGLGRPGTHAEHFRCRRAGAHDEGNVGPQC